MLVAGHHGSRCRFGEDSGFLTQLPTLLGRYGLPTTLAQANLELPSQEELISYLLADKKAHGGRLTIIVPNEPGSVWVDEQIDPAASLEAVRGNGQVREGGEA